MSTDKEQLSNGSLGKTDLHLLSCPLISYSRLVEESLPDSPPNLESMRVLSFGFIISMELQARRGVIIIGLNKSSRVTYSVV